MHPSSQRTHSRVDTEARTSSSLRRCLLSLGGAALFATLPGRALADDPSLELDGEVYAGQSHGAWACGPRGVARYGGLGARGRISERPAIAEKGAGYYGTLGGVAEYEQVRVTGCDASPEAAETKPCRVPRNHMMFGAGITSGYRWQYIGVSLGFLAYQGYDEVSSRSPDWSSFPSLELDFGEEARGLSWPIGFGAPLVSTYRRPTFLYTGPRYATQYFRVETLLGYYRTGPASWETTALRMDAALEFRISEHLWLGPHAALGNEDPIDPEIGLRAGLWY